MNFKLFFNFNQIEKSPIFFKGVVSSSAFDIQDEELTKYLEVEYDIQVNQISGGAILSGELIVSTSKLCPRCLAEFDYKISIKDVNHYYKKEIGRDFDLIPDLREDILIALPSNQLCTENCKGLCPICGVDLNKKKCQCKREVAVDFNDSVWNRLDELKIKSKKSKKIKGAFNGKSKKKKI
ncbi:MAG TPA: DUF177 domain-containing protein [Victivallales bacterium]|nr:DUF177 domain-containing protein [Victivallales bacterium]HPO90475.1 DUF177 domain-containing protein [Victivallales bacterium]HRR06178.1 DUF177 domain-containing protein [Victivallales bacterium]HRR28517.1 DUF177 domain-containing protein [Victivallales bacterium]HRU02254.1 DUF177 domain-containing protein [Victivallales bacterium]